MTLTDEVGRRQKVYSDVLGRTARTEVLNWDSSIYATTTSTYDARDEVTQVRQYAGAEGSPAFQDTTMTYDGYGRLKTKHAPEQNAGTTTVWDYNSDDTTQKITDARGASQTLSYNSRHLVTGITYAVPGGSGITVPAAASFAYDAAGNRTSMTDGLGSVSYSYNQLSQVTSEARTYSVGTFTLSYAYNLAGALTSLTDPFGAQISYGYDVAGRLSGVTGSSFAGVSSYVSNVQYRAWGALKSAAYGDSKTLAVSYNNALQVTNFEVPGVLKKSYQYNDDGRLKFTQDQLTANSKFDRSYGYDHMGRVTKALSGAEARGQGPSNDRPYNETLTYDQMGHLTTLDRRHWDRLEGSGPDTVVNNRVQGWTYDADGRAQGTSSGYFIYDAAGRVLTFGDNDPYKTDQEFTGNGQRAKTIEWRFDTPSDQWVREKATYYLTSSVLGKLVTEVSEQGLKERTLVYAGGTVLAEQLVSPGTEALGWEHADASGASYRQLNLAGESGSAEMDPLGADAGKIKPSTWNVPDNKGLPVPYNGILEMLTNPGGACVLDRMPVPCEIYNNLMNAGGTAVEQTFRGPEKSPGNVWSWQIIQTGIRSVGPGLFRTEILTGWWAEAYDVELTQYIALIDSELFAHALGPQNYAQKRSDLSPSDKEIRVPKVNERGTGLSQCAMKVLGEFFGKHKDVWGRPISGDLKNIRLISGIPEVVKKYAVVEADAFTYGTNVYLRDGLSSAALDTFTGLALQAHEYIHTQQAKLHGAAAIFGILYLGDSADRWLTGGDPYGDNYFEGQAVDWESDFRRWLENRYGKDDPCKLKSPAGGAW